jgi:20S proteasome subunit beta 3
MYKYKEERDIAPETFMNMVCSMQYAKRYELLQASTQSSYDICSPTCRFGPWFAEPVVAGLDKDNKPYVSASDCVGAPVAATDFVVSGTCTENLYGTCESLYKKDMEPDALFEVLAQSLLAAVDRDALSGWGGVVHIITAEGIITKELKARKD